MDNIIEIIESLLINGIIAMVARVITVMLPGVLSFFIVFTILDELGLLLLFSKKMDAPLRRCGSCGDHCLSMLMGFGCNACAVRECRMIEDQKTRFIAIITNGISPCNGKLPTLIILASLIFSMFGLPCPGYYKILTTIFILASSVSVTLIAARILSKKREWQFTNNPDSGEIIPICKEPGFKNIKLSSLTSKIASKSLSIIMRGITAAIPSGVVIWLLLNIHCRGVSLFEILTDALSFPAGIIGLDGVILASFILSFPANEMFIPIMLMAYGGGDSFSNISGISALAILSESGLSLKNAICAFMFTMLHYPCLTTILTVKNETGSLKAALLSFVIPTIPGIIFCASLNFVFFLISLG